jgi:hypothetical protein
LQLRCFCAATYFSSRSSTTEQRLCNVVNEQRLRSTVNEQRATASSANDDVVADDEQEQTSAQTLALIPTIVWHVTVRTSYVYIDDILVVIIPSNSTLPL